MDINLLKKCLAGGCSPEEVYKIMEWLNSDEMDDDLISHIEEDLNRNLEFVSNTDEVPEKFKKIIRNIYEKSASERYRLYGASKSLIKPYLKIAASIAIIVASAIFFMYQKSNRNDVPVIAEKIGKIVLKENDRGRKSTIFLPDGSVVHLNSESSIKYNESQFDSVRIAYLTGEGFFEIASDSIHPFKVVANNIEITALGTAFNVNSYQGENEIRVSLVEGKVLIKNNQPANGKAEELFLNPGHEVVYSKENNRFTDLKAFNPRKVYGWKDGILYFDQANLPTVIQMLERWFDVDFHLVNESPVQWRYTAQFHNQSLRNILESLSFSQNFKYEIEGKKIIVVFN